MEIKKSAAIGQSKIGGKGFDPTTGESLQDKCIRRGGKWVNGSCVFTDITTPVSSAPDISGQKYFAGNKELTKEEYEEYKRRLPGYTGISPTGEAGRGANQFPQSQGQVSQPLQSNLTTQPQNNVQNALNAQFPGRINQGIRETAVGNLTDPLISQLETGINNPAQLESVGQTVAGAFEGVYGNRAGDNKGFLAEAGAAQAVPVANFVMNPILNTWEDIFGLERGTIKRPNRESFFNAEIPGSRLGGGEGFKPGIPLAGSLTSAEIVALIVLGGAAIPWVAQTSAMRVIGGKVLASSGIIKLATTGVLGTAAYLGYGKVTDINRAKINNLNAASDDAGETSTTLVSAYENGADGMWTIEQLEVLIDTFDKSERDMLIAAKYNIKFRTSDEYVRAMAKNKKTREKMIASVNAIKSLMTTGKKQVNPEGLMFDVSRLGGEQ